MSITNLSPSTILAASAAFFVGIIGVWEATDYSFGTFREIGPAIFPLALSILLLLAGIGIIAEHFVSVTIDTPAPKPSSNIVICSILGGPIAFALLITQWGLIPAVFACVLISSFAERKLTILQLLALSSILAIGCTLIFVWLLNLPLRPIIW